MAAALSERRREVVARQVAEQKLCGAFQREIKDHRTEAGNDTDRDAQQEPLAQPALRIAEPKRPPAAAGGAAAGWGSSAGPS